MRRHPVLVAVALVVLAVASLSAIQGPGSQVNRPPRTVDQRFDRDAQMRGDRRTFVGQLSLELVSQAEYLSQSAFDYFMGWNGTINNAEQAVLFKSEEFTAACRLFNRLVQDRSDYYRRELVRTNLYNASRYLSVSFRQLEEQMRLSGMPDDFNRMRRDGRRYDLRDNRFASGRFGLAEIRRILNRIESEFSLWR